jgi:hypothetical protein
MATPLAHRVGNWNGPPDGQDPTEPSGLVMQGVSDLTGGT